VSLRPTWDERCPTLGLAAALYVLAGWRGLVIAAGAADRIERWLCGESEVTL
jgi:hypothetical protein